MAFPRAAAPWFLVVLWAGTGRAEALAGELNFSPDRPGIGDSAATVGAGQVMVESGLMLIPAPFAVGTSSWMARFGVDDGIELRLRAPDIGWSGGLALGTIGLGVKVAGVTSDRWSVSLVPEVNIDPATGAVGGAVGGNVGLGIDIVGVWAHAGTGVGQLPDGAVDLSLLLGGGASVAVGGGGVYVNGGYDVGTLGAVGGGGWWGFGDRLQLDIGVDVPLAAPAVPVIVVGMSAGF